MAGVLSNPYSNGLYYSFNQHLQEHFKQKVHKISVDAGFNCPNRDGTLSETGCSYCNIKSFTPSKAQRLVSIKEQIQGSIPLLAKRYKAKKFLVYFQPFSNTYGDPDYLCKVYWEALEHPDVVGIAIGTRPDCVDDQVLDIFKELAKSTYVWVEYGLQSMHDFTLRRINRGHSLQNFIETYNKTRAIHNLRICVHIIHGLPGENRQNMLSTVEFLNSIAIDGIKIHPLHIVKETMMEKEFLQGEIKTLDFEEYKKRIGESLIRLSPKVVIQRLIGNSPANITLSPRWMVEEKNILHQLNQYLKEHDYIQGKLL